MSVETPAFLPSHPRSARTTPSASDAPLPVLGRDVTVPLAEGGEVAYAALDQAASAPVLQRVWDDLAAYAPYYGSVHRGGGHLSRLSTELYERSRATVADFLGCRHDDQLHFTRGTTDSLNLLARALPRGTRVFVFETEHHASLLPWRDQHTTVLDAPRSPAEAVTVLEEALRVAESGPKLVCVTGASNVTGELWPVRQLARAAHRHGARLVLDAAQLAPHRPIDITELEIDWVAFSGHKLYAPFGAGVLAGRPDWLADAEPYLAGGGASRGVARDTAGDLTVEWHTGTARHEAGTPNVIGALALASACRALDEAGWDNLLRREHRLLVTLLDALAQIPEVTVLSLFGQRSERVGVVSLVVEGWDSSRLAEVLSSQYGIGVRDGLFCAHPLLRTLLGADADAPAECGSTPGGSGGTDHVTGALRVSFGVGTPPEHVERFARAVRDLVRDGSR